MNSTEVKRKTEATRRRPGPVIRGSVNTLGKTFPHGTTGFKVATPPPVKFEFERVRQCRAFSFTKFTGTLLPLAAPPRRISGLLASRLPLTSEHFSVSPLPRRFETPSQTLTVGFFSCFQILSYVTSGMEDLSRPTGQILLSVGYCLVFRSPRLHGLIVVAGFLPCCFFLFGEPYPPSSTSYTHTVLFFRLTHPPSYISVVLIIIGSYTFWRGPQLSDKTCNLFSLLPTVFKCAPALPLTRTPG